MLSEKLEQAIFKYETFIPTELFFELRQIASNFRELERKLEAYEQRDAGNEICEAHGDWQPMEEMHLSYDGVWLCQEAWNELVEAHDE